MPAFLQRLKRLFAAPKDPPPDAREAARWAYRLILLREPESEAVVRHLANAGGAREMRNQLLQSKEARENAGIPPAVSLDGNEPPQPIEVHIDPAQRDALFAKVQAVWHALGQEQPHWSVATNEEYRAGNIEQSLERFYATGEGNVQTLLRTLQRNGIDPAMLRSCMDFGCGVGRLTVPLAKRFAQIHAVDVSASHLAVAREAFDKRGIANVTTHHLDRIDGLSALPPVDLVYSVIVLQHNPPPVMRALVDGLLGRLRPGGVAVFQLPTYLPKVYRFVLSEYLASGGQDMEMHALPQSEVFAAAREAGVDVLEVLEDTWTGFGLGSRSNTFVMRRPGAATA